jgi:hypothetical protein
VPNTLALISNIYIRQRAKNVNNKTTIYIYVYQVATRRTSFNEAVTGIAVEMITSSTDTMMK